jgi:hypothetical protein
MGFYAERERVTPYLSLLLATKLSCPNIRNRKTADAIKAPAVFL